MSAIKNYDILGVKIDALTMNQAAAMIIEHAGSKQPSCYVVKPYVEFLDEASRQPALKTLLNNAWLRLPDAISLQWASTYLYGERHSWWRVMILGAQIIVRPNALKHYIPEKFAGATFSWKIVKMAAKQQQSIYLIGSPKGSSITKTAEIIKQAEPQITIAGTHAGIIGGKSGTALRTALTHKDIEADLVADLIKTKPDLIMVGMGFPLQEELMAKLVKQVNHGVFIGEGGTFDYDSFGGGRTRAPRFVQHIGLEWLWRLLLEPSRIRRQLAIPRFIWAVYRDSKKA